MIDLDFELTPKGDVKLDQTAFGGFCVKGRTDGKAKYVSPEGEVKLPSPHHLKPKNVLHRYQNSVEEGTYCHSE